MTQPAVPHAYARAVLDRECAGLAATQHGRNDRLNRAAFACGRLVPDGHLGRNEVESRLMAAAEQSGYAGKDGPKTVLATVRSGIEAGMRDPRDLGPGAAATSPPGRPAPALSGVDLPAWTEPDPEGRPKLTGIGQAEPPRFEDEARRHVYARDGQPVRVKVKRSCGSFTDWYRVRRPADGAVGWQARKPAGFVPMPYVPASCGTAFDPARCGEDLVWAEGEKDADAVARIRLAAFTFGSSNDVPDVSALVAGRHVIVVVDNDKAGRDSIKPKVGAAVRGGAASVRVIEFDDLPEGGDAADFLAAGGDAGGLLGRARQVHPEDRPPMPERVLEDRPGEEPARSGGDAGDEARPSRPDDDLSTLNARYCVVPDNGLVRVLTFDRQGQGEHARETPCQATSGTDPSAT